MMGKVALKHITMQLGNWLHWLHGQIAYGVYRQPSDISLNSTPKREGQTTKASHQELLIMNYSPGLPQDIPRLRSCSVNRAKMQLKGHLVIKVTPKISMSTDISRTFPPRVTVNGATGDG